jgi:hypothetical protein
MRKARITASIGTAESGLRVARLRPETKGDFIFDDDNSPLFSSELQSHPAHRNRRMENGRNAVFTFFLQKLLRPDSRSICLCPCSLRAEGKNPEESVDKSMTCNKIGAGNRKRLCGGCQKLAVKKVEESF